MYPTAVTALKTWDPLIIPLNSIWWNENIILLLHFSSAFLLPVTSFQSYAFRSLVLVSSSVTYSCRLVLNTCQNLQFYSVLYVLVFLFSVRHTDLLHSSSPLPAHNGVHFIISLVLCIRVLHYLGDRGSTVVKVLCYKSEGRWFDSSWC